MILKEFKIHSEIQEKLSKIIGLVYKINCETDYAVFCDFSGHTNQLDIRINRDKDKGGNISDTHAIYLSPFIDSDNREESEKEGYVKINVRLNTLIDNLEKLLPVPLKIEL
jgi:hypothetical protein